MSKIKKTARKPTLRPANDPRILRVLKAMDWCNAYDGNDPDSSLWADGHNVADIVIDHAMAPGNLSYAALRPVVVALLRRTSADGLASALEQANVELERARKVDDECKRINQVAELLGIDCEAAEKVIEQHAKLGKVAAIAAVH